MFSVDRQPKDHVRPALAAWRTVVEFAEPATVRGLFREAVADAQGGEPVEDAELTLAEALVDDRSGRAAGERVLLRRSAPPSAAPEYKATIG